ncbi:hypothetical protein OsI_00415 [Oryza sativa Indica Group]|uniref:CCHC-type domain-containing protein n=1 Tax=Oryza sativa subsp. indica TaxID=39946 RepID=B8ADB0_ORYSI|nr:hypothetical protein OsI_00415 [Oryza sativa Indica Group]
MDYGAIGSNRRGGGREWGQHGCASESLSPARHGGYWLGKPETEKRRGLRRRAAAAAGLPPHEADVWAPPRHGPPPLVTRLLRSAVVAALPLLLPLCAAGANSGDNTSSPASKSLSSQFVKFSSAGLDGNIRPFLGGGALLSTDIKLNGQNYQEWELSARMLLRSIGQASHLTDDPPDEKTDATKIKAWKTADDRVMGFIFMSVEVPIRMSFRDHSTAKEMWDYLKQRYTQESGALRFSLLKNLHNLQQQDQSIEEFYNAFTRLSGQLEAQTPKGASGCAQCKAREKHDQENLVYQFVMRLSSQFESIRVQLLGRPTRPTMAEALADLIAEETRLCSLDTTPTPVVTHNVMAAPQRVGAPMGGIPEFSSIAKSDRICSHCKKVGHISNDCFYLHPEKLVDYRARRAAVPRPRATASAPVFLDITAAGPSSTSAGGSASSAVSCAPQSLVARPSYQASDWSWPSP